VTPDLLANDGRPARGRDWRKFVLIEVALLLAAAFVWLVWQLVIPIGHTVVLFLLGIAFAFVLNDPATYFGRRLGGRRGLGILVEQMVAASPQPVVSPPAGD